MSGRSHLSADWRNALFEFKTHVSISNARTRVVRSVEIMGSPSKLYRLEDDVRTTAIASRIGVAEGRVGVVKHLLEPSDKLSAFIGVQFSSGGAMHYFRIMDVVHLPAPTLSQDGDDVQSALHTA